MATFDLVLLSSSPPSMGSGAPRRLATPPSNQQRVAISPSSPAASLAPGDTMIRAVGALKSGSRAAPVPEGVARGFATAGSLVKSHHFNLEHGEELELPDEEPAHLRRKSLQEANDADRMPKKPKKRATKTAPSADIEDLSAKTTKQPRVRRTKKSKDAECQSVAPAITSHLDNVDTPAPIDREGQHDLPAPQAKSRKPRARKEKPAGGPIEKDMGGDTALNPQKRTRKSAPKKPKKNTGTVSEHFVGSTNRGSEQDANHNRQIEGVAIWEVPSSPRHAKGTESLQPTIALDQPLDLEEAVSRRRDWTPVRDTETPAVGDENIEKENGCLPGQQQFSAMLSSFAFATDVRPPAAITSEATTVMKRRRVELNDAPAQQAGSRDSSPEKSRAPKKKARTITDLVTGQYAPKQAPVPVPGTLFDSNVAAITTKVPLNDVSPHTKQTVPTKAVRKRRPTKASEKKDLKPKKPSAKAVVKSNMIADKLLSPSSALCRLQRQDILFGTSSQLALEESPTSVRQLQDALRESESLAMLHMNHAPSPTASDSRLLQRLRNVQAKSGLWAASARDEDGHLLEKLDNVYIPEPDRTQDLPLLMDSFNAIPETAYLMDDPPQSRDLEHDPVQISSDLPTPPRTCESDEREQPHDSVMEDVSFEDIDNYVLPPPSNQHDGSSFLDIDDFPPSTQRPPPVSLPGSPHPPPSVPIIAASSGSPKKRKGRPPKSQSSVPPPAHKAKTSVNTKTKAKVIGREDVPKTPSKRTGRFTNVEEILDSEDNEALSPTPPRTSKFADSPPLSLVPSMPALWPSDPVEEVVSVSKVPTALLGWNIIKDSIFIKITAALRALPPTTDPSRPSWHEKILLYDAIVLEDFTAFLNASTSIRTWRRATQKQIKAFNKQRKERKELPLTVDDEGDEVLVVAKELETWMVQGWCQEMSICCINKEGKGRGTARKGLY